MSHRSAVNAREMSHGPDIEGVDRTFMWHGYAHRNGKMVGITRMNVPEKMPKQLLLTNTSSLILIPKTDSYIYHLD